MTHSEKTYEVCNAIKKQYPRELEKVSFSIIDDFRVDIYENKTWCGYISIDGITFKLFVVLCGETKFDCINRQFYNDVKWAVGFTTSKQLN